jgi:glycerol uptake facilitator protein
VDGRAPAGFAGIVIGFIVYGIIILVGPITGAALNPARQIGPVLVETVINFKNIGARWSELWVYIVGPIAGGLVGAFLYEAVGHHQTAEEPGLAVPERVHAEA